MGQERVRRAWQAAVGAARHRWIRLRRVFLAPGLAVPLAALGVAGGFVILTGLALGSAATLGDPGYFAAPRGDQGEFTIYEVDPAGPGAQAGLAVGDVITRVNSQTVGGWQARPPGPGPAGGQVLLELRRLRSDGEALHWEVSVGLRPQFENPLIGWAFGSLVAFGLSYLGVALVAAFARRGDPAAGPLLVCCGSLAFGFGTSVWAVGLGMPIGEAQFGLLTLGFCGLLHFLLVFPRPHPLLHWLRQLGPPAVQRHAGGVWLLYLLPLAGWALRVPLISAPLTVLAALAALIGSFRSEASAVERAQVRWITWSFLVALGGPALLSILGGVLPAGRLQNVIGLITPHPVLLFPLGLGCAILRYRLLDVDQVLRFTLLYPLLGMAGLAIFDGLVLLGNRLAVATLGLPATEHPVASVAALALLAGLWRPVRGAVRRLIDRQFFPHRPQRDRYVHEMAEHLPETTQVSQLQALLTDQTAEWLQLAQAWLVRSADGDDAAGTGGGAHLPAGGLARIALRAPYQLALPPEADALHPPVVLADAPPFDAWYAAGARLVVPLWCGPSKGDQDAAERVVLGWWVLGARRSRAPYDGEDLGAFAAVGRQAAVRWELLALRDERASMLAASPRRDAPHPERRGGDPSATAP